MSAMQVDEAGVRYECGCDGLVVGQSFQTGLLVCPVHGEPVGPWDRPAQPGRHTVTIAVDLETIADGGARAFVDWLERLLLHDGRVRALTVSLEERTPAP